MATFLLNSKWDLVIKNGQFALTDTNYEIAQNVSNAIRLFTNDAFFAQSDGIPHFANELGEVVNQALLISRLQKQALTVSGVVRARAVIDRIEERNLYGTVFIDTIYGDIIEISFAG